MIQNVAACVIIRTQMREHISLVLASLHWQPVRSRIGFKILLLTYKALNGVALSYLRELIVLYCPIRTLLSQDADLHVVPKDSRSRMVASAFDYQVAYLWN